MWETWKEAVDAAARRLKPYVRETPLEPSPDFSGGIAEVRLKLECLQHTRSFKVRGAVNRLLALTHSEAAREVVAASTGNHGLAVAYGLRRLGMGGTIFLPETASPRKVALLERQSARLAFFGQDAVETERHARRQAEEQGLVYVSPYNDVHVVAGQGTIGRELAAQWPELDAVFVPVGGGGLIGGIAAYLKAVNPAVRVVGCLPERSPVMYESIVAGRIVAGTVEPTLSDATAGGMEADAITFELCRRLVDEWILVSEEDIRAGIRWIFDHHGLVIEGAAGVAVAACRRRIERGDVPFRRAVVVLCGANIDMTSFREIVC